MVYRLEIFTALRRWYGAPLLLCVLASAIISAHTFLSLAATSPFWRLLRAAPFFAANKNKQG
jgi:hypothetical protein